MSGTYERRMDNAKDRASTSVGHHLRHVPSVQGSVPSSLEEQVTTEEERRIVAEILDKRDRGEPLTAKEQERLQYSPYGTASSCRCK